MGANIQDFAFGQDWTPVLTCSGTPPTGIVYAGQLGYFVKSGALVIAGFQIIITSKGSGGVGNMLISGLPYPVKAGTPLGMFPATIQWESWTITGRTCVGARGLPGTKQMDIIALGTTTIVNLTYAELLAGSRIWGTLTYLTD